MKRITFKKYAGVKMRGSVDISSWKYGSPDSHLQRAGLLTALVESGGKFGCVMNYDGTGMTAGIHQAIAVYPRSLAPYDHNPKNDQGPLWKLLNRMRSAAPYSIHLVNLFEAMLDCDWYLEADGTLRNIHDGVLIHGCEIRHRLTGSADGVMPMMGVRRKEAERWVRLFNEAFSDSSTFRVQCDYGVEHFSKRAHRTKLRFSPFPSLKRKTIQKAVYGSTSLGILQDEEMLPEFDLAMCMFWSHSVNAPGAALKKLCKIVVPRMAKHDLAVQLIQKLGNTSFGRWDDDLKNGRYQRTRRYAMKMGVWDRSLFVGKSAVMPKGFKG